MSETSRMLKKIMRSSGWTQEQLAAKLGVSFASMNAWVNGRTKPRAAMLRRIRKLYLAQDITGMSEPVYVTVVNVDLGLKVGDAILLEKDVYNLHDDEAIMVSKMLLDDDENGVPEFREDEEMDEFEVMESFEESEEPDFIDDDLVGDEFRKDELSDENRTESIKTMTNGDSYRSEMYVANSVNTVVRGTKSAGRIYDSFKSKARAQVLFIIHRMAIVRIVEWDYEE